MDNLKSFEERQLMKARHFSGLIYAKDFCTYSPCGNIVNKIVSTERFNKELQKRADRIKQCKNREGCCE